MKPADRTHHIYICTSSMPKYIMQSYNMHGSVVMPAEPNTTQQPQLSFRALPGGPCRSSSSSSSLSLISQNKSVRDRDHKQCPRSHSHVITEMWLELKWPFILKNTQCFLTYSKGQKQNMHYFKRVHFLAWSNQVSWVYLEKSWTPFGNAGWKKNRTKH